MKNGEPKFKGVGIAVVAAMGCLGFVWWQISSSNTQAQNIASASGSALKLGASLPVAQSAATNAAPATVSTPAVGSTQSPAATASVSVPVSETTSATVQATSTDSSAVTASSDSISTASASAPLEVAPAADSYTAAPVPGGASGNVIQTQQPQVPAVPSGLGGIIINSDSYYQPALLAEGSDQSRLPILFNLDYQTIYDSNIYISRSDRKADVIYRTSPSLIFESTRLDKAERQPTKKESDVVGWQENDSYAGSSQVENYLRASYTAIWNKYNQYSTNDSLDHNALLFYRNTGEKTIFEASQGFTTFTGPNVDVAGTLEQTTYTTRLFGSYAITGKTTLELEAVQAFNRYATGFNTNEWTISPYINYEVLPKVTLGLGTIVGVLDVAGGINQTYQQPNIRAIYQYGEKLNFTARFGWEVREFNGYDQEMTSPMFALAANWRPFDGTNISVEGYRRTVPSIATDDESYDATGVTIDFKQRFMRKFYAGLRSGFEHSEYFQIPSGDKAGRDQDYFTIRPNVGWLPNELLTFNIFYQFAENISTLKDTGFIDQQVGMQASFSY